VKADASYDVRRNPKNEHGRGLIALRTFGGQGIIDLIGASDLRVESNSLLIMQRESILRYRWGAGVWDFHWFEFRPLGPVNLPLARILAVPSFPDEERDMSRCFDFLQGRGPRSHAAASAGFASLLWRWLSNADPMTSEDASVSAAVSVLQAACQGPGAVAQAAVAAGIGERRLRQIFQSRLGTSPKAFAEKLRLNLAGQYLHQGGMTVAKVAELLGYSSPFHFSRAFKRQFGVPPSQW
jgi:AraC-like DNA-binding protein